MRAMRFALLAGCLLSAGIVSAAIFGSVRGIVHDPQHRPVQGAMVMLHAKTSDWSNTATTDSNGEFQFVAVSLGEYTVSVASPGFTQTAQTVTVESGTQPVLHYQLALASLNENVTVS